MAETDLQARHEALLGTLKRTAAALRDAGIPFAIGGGIASWGRGGPRTENDVDVMVTPADAERAQQALVAQGMRGETPPEEWLLKAWDGEILVDIIFAPQGVEITEERLAAVDHLSLAAITVPVLDLEDVLVSKLLALDEHELDLTAVVELTRAVREQVDWADVRRRTSHSAFAAGFFTTIERLGLVSGTGAAAQPRGRGQIRVVDAPNP